MANNPPLRTGSITRPLTCHFDIISGPLITKKNASVSFATAFANNVLPVPCGPYNNTPFGGFTLNYEIFVDVVMVIQSFL